MMRLANHKGIALLSPKMRSKVGHVMGLLFVALGLGSACQCLLLSRLRCAACLARLPQIAMLHHLLARLLVWSANARVQPCPSHAFTWVNSSSHTNFASASPIGSSRDSGDRQRRIIRSSRQPPSLW